MKYWASAIMVFFISLPSFAAGTLSDNILIDSNSLGYTLQFRIYIPENTKKTDTLPTVYVADGQWYISDGKMPEILDSEIAAGRMRPVIAIFMDSGEPGNPRNNRRNDEFMCNATYAQFYRDELIPTIEHSFPVSKSRDDRVIMGLSFGGLNAACFGLMIPDSFAGIGMHSPANSEHLKLLSDMYTKREKLPLKIFFSTGTKRDNTKAARKFHNVLERQGYDMTYTEVPFGHNWDNWGPLVDDLLLTFFATTP
ncbi:alpha/beta hydrolase [Kordiimonas sp.]|uniref:alpha/beta hydrolase n=1 Tax=Kordiimonas sp. TaxID=1970157 RepID=UPI003A8E0B83